MVATTKQSISLSGLALTYRSRRHHQKLFTEHIIAVLVKGHNLSAGPCLHITHIIYNGKHSLMNELP